MFKNNVHRLQNYILFIILSEFNDKFRLFVNCRVLHKTRSQPYVRPTHDPDLDRDLRWRTTALDTIN
jgi:hypothetical protein